MAALLKLDRPLFDGMADLLTPADLSMLTGQCEATIRRMCSSGELPAVRLGHRWYVPRTRFADYCEGVRYDNNEQMH